MRSKEKVQSYIISCLNYLNSISSKTDTDRSHDADIETRAKLEILRWVLNEDNSDN